MDSKLKYYFSLAAIFALLAIHPALDAASWGTTEEVVEFEGTNWDNVYFDMNGVYFEASIPNYSGTLLQNGTVSLNGQTEDDAAYSIITFTGARFKPPKSGKEFLKIIQDANPEYIVSLIDSKSFGATYAVDLTPSDPDATIYWRFLLTNNRIIQMGTDDFNENRRLNFFESIHIYK